MQLINPELYAKSGFEAKLIMKFLVTCWVIFFSLNCTASETSLVIEENDFQQLSSEMKEKSLGVVLMFHAEHCPYCALMENDILSPMVKSGEYEDKVLIRKLQFDEARDIKDFMGKVVEPSDLGAKYNITVTPTLVFLDSEGNEKAKKMIGINTVEYFGAYLDSEIEKLQRNISSDIKNSQATKKTAQIN